MRVLQVLNCDSGHGGGPILMERLHHSLRGAGIDSRILCGIKNLDSPYSTEIPPLRLVEGVLRRAAGKLGLNDVYYARSFRIRKMQTYLQADVLHIHGIHGGYFSYLALPVLTQRKPAVFTLHDMWPLTGHCTYSGDCTRWMSGCGACPYPDTWPPITKDSTRLEWSLKQWVYEHSSLDIIAPSRWLADQATKSMLGRFPIHHIPNGIDTEIYHPMDIQRCRAQLGIGANKKVLMFIAMTMDLSNYGGFRKGGDLLVKALSRLPQSLKKEMVLLLLGEGGESIAPYCDIPTVDLGYVSSDVLKAIAYGAADLFVHPTRADNLPLTLLESMACGTPMVSFNVGGVPDLVRPGITGYLAEPENPEDLRDGIVALLEDDVARNRMSEACRRIALEEYTMDLCRQRHIDLYTKLSRHRECH